MEDGRVEIVVGLYDFLISSKKFIQGTVLNTRAFAFLFVSSVRSSSSHPDLLLIHHHHPLFQITPVLNTGLSLSEPLQLYKGYNAI